MPKKTKAMTISATTKTQSNQGISLHLAQDQIDLSDSERLLGVQDDKNLNWKSEVNLVIKNAIQNCIFFKEFLKHYINIPIRKLFYNAYILPHLDYCCSIWGNCSNSQLESLIRFQKRAARVILDKDFDTPSQELFATLNWMTFSERLQYKKSIIVYKSLNDMC